MQKADRAVRPTSLGRGEWGEWDREGRWLHKGRSTLTSRREKEGFGKKQILLVKTSVAEP